MEALTWDDTNALARDESIDMDGKDILTPVGHVRWEDHAKVNYGIA